MGDVADGIIELAIIQRPPRPIGKARTLIDLDAEIGGDQVGIADLFAKPQCHGSDLGIEQRGRRFSCKIVDDFKILPAGVKHLQDLVFNQQLQQRGEIDARCLGVDGGGFGGGGDLDEAQIRVIGAFAHEFGINRDEISLRQTFA